MNDQASEPNGTAKIGAQLIPAAQTVPAMRDPYGLACSGTQEA